MASPSPLADATSPAPAQAAAPDYALGFLLADVLRLVRAEFRQQATGLRLTPALSRLLFYVDQKPGCSQAELASFRPDRTDRRTFRIHLGTAAAPLVARMHEALARTTDKLLLGIPAEEEAALRRTLQRMCVNLTTGAA